MSAIKIDLLCPAVCMKFCCMFIKDVEPKSSANNGGQTQLREAVRTRQVANVMSSS